MIDDHDKALNEIGQTDALASSIDDRELLRKRTLSANPRRRAQAVSDADSDSEVAENFQLRAIFLCRESGEYSFLLLTKMIKQVLLPFQSHPEVAKALKYGVTPMRSNDEGEIARAELRAQEIVVSSGGSRRLIGVFFTIGEYGFFYSLASAGRSTVDGENSFTSEFVNLIAEARPQQIVTGWFSRMVRVTWIGEQLRRTMADHRVTLRCSESDAVIDPRTQGGKREWELLANAAENEYLSTLNRLLTGTTLEYLEGRFPRSEKSLPLGYRKVGGKGPDANRVVVDSAQAPVVRRLIELAASDANEFEIADELSDLGVRTRSSSGDPSVLIRDLKYPDIGVRSLFGHLPTYLSGSYVIHHEMTLPHQDDFHGVKVQRDSPGDFGYLEFVLEFGVPDSGWHTEQMIRTAIDRRLTRKQPTVPQWDRQKMKPLAGIFDFVGQDCQFVLHSSDQGYYTLRSRPAEQKFASNGRRNGFGDLEGDLVGTFKAGDLHVAVAAALRGLSGAITNLSCPEIPSPTADEIDDVRVQLAAASQAADRAIDSELTARTATERSAYQEKARTWRQQEVALRAQLAELQRRNNPRNILLLNAEQLAAVVAELEETNDRAATVLNSTLRRWLVGCSIDATPGYPLATVTVHVDAPSTAGHLRLGPLTHPVANRCYGEDRGPFSSADHRNREIARLLLLEDSTHDERSAVWSAESFDAKSYTRRMHATLATTRLPMAARSAILLCPIVGVRRAVLAPLFDLDLDHGLNEDFAAEIVRVYTSEGFNWASGWCPGGMVLRRAVIAFIQTYATTPDLGLDRAQIEQSFGLNPAQVYDMLNHNSGKQTPRPPLLEDIGGWYQRARTRRQPHPMGIKRCPHCGTRTLTHALTVPEVPGGILCSQCQRTPSSTIVYPDGYFEGWEGPQTNQRFGIADPRNAAMFAPPEPGHGIITTRRFSLIVPSLRAPR